MEFLEVDVVMLIDHRDRHKDPGSKIPSTCIFPIQGGNIAFLFWNSGTTPRNAALYLVAFAIFDLNSDVPRLPLHVCRCALFTIMAWRC